MVMTPPLEPTFEPQASDDADNYAREFIATMKSGITPLYKPDLAGEYGKILAVLIKSYNPQRTDLFEQSLQALCRKHEKLKKLLEPTTIELVGTLMSEVKPKQVEWLWFPRIAVGKIAMLDGDPGMGKSIITVDIAARVSTGARMPDGAPGVKGGVVLITPEDEPDDTIQPRLARAGADLTKIVSIGKIKETTDSGMVYERPFTLPDDLPILEAAIKRVKAKLVIIDPVMSIMGSKDTYKDNEVRSILAPVQMLVARAGAACLMVRHLTKGGSDKAIYRGGGSIAFIGLARTGFMVVKDPHDESRMVFAHIKSNAERLAHALTYTIVNDGDSAENQDFRPYIKWGDEIDITPQELLTVPRVNTGGNRQEILTLLENCKPDVRSVEEVQKELQKDHPNITINNVKLTLKRMYDNGEIDKAERGKYCAK